MNHVFDVKEETAWDLASGSHSSNEETQFVWILLAIAIAVMTMLKTVFAK